MVGSYLHINLPFAIGQSSPIHRSPDSLIAGIAILQWSLNDRKDRENRTCRKNRLSGPLGSKSLLLPPHLYW